MAKKKKNKKNKFKKNQERMMGWTAGNANRQPGLMAGLSRFLPSRRSEQFLLGALIGAAATYVLSDEQIRGKLIKSGIQLYSGLAGGIEEMKEQMADIKAEMAAQSESLVQSPQE